MKIAYLVNQYPKVSHSFIRREIRALEALGIQVSRFSIRGWDAPSPDAEDDKERRQTHYVLRQNPFAILAAIVAASLARPVNFAAALALTLRVARCSDRSLFLHLAYLAEACVVARWIRAQGIQHLHAHFGTNSTDVAMLAGVLCGCPYSFTAHGPEEFDRPLALSLGEKIRRAAFVVAITSFARSQLFRWAEFTHWKKVRIVRCGVDGEYLRATEEAQFSGDLVCVGRLCEQKGQMLLIAALHRLKAAGVQCRLVLAGDGEFRASIESLVAQLDLQQQVTITGWISGEQVKAELRRARALVLPSFAEGLPVVIMEAMAMGKPVVSTYIAGIPELVADGVTGWLIPAGDESRLADAMQACLRTDAAKLRAMGMAARERVIANHDVDKEAAKLAELFRASVFERDQAPAAAEHGGNDLQGERESA